MRQIIKNDDRSMPVVYRPDEYHLKRIRRAEISNRIPKEYLRRAALIYIRSIRHGWTQQRFFKTCRVLRTAVSRTAVMKIVNTEFFDEWRSARAEVAHKLLDKADAIADRTLVGEIEPAAAKVALDLIKFRLSKEFKDGIYGQKINIDGDSFQAMSDEALKRRYEILTGQKIIEGHVVKKDSENG